MFLRPEHLQKVLTTLSKIESCSYSCQLSFVLSCHGDFVDSMPEEFLQRALLNLEACVTNHEGKCERTCQCELVYVIRTVANVDKEVYNVVLDSLWNNDLGGRLWAIFNKDSSGLKESLLWLFGNLYNSCGDKVLFDKI